MNLIDEIFLIILQDDLHFQFYFFRFHLIDELIQYQNLYLKYFHFLNNKLILNKIL
jgi:hypothetical protein